MQHRVAGELTAQTLTVGGAYKWRYQPDRLIYLGKKGSWHQFSKIGDPRDVWCEVLDSDLKSIEATQPIKQGEQQ